MTIVNYPSIINPCFIFRIKLKILSSNNYVNSLLILLFSEKNGFKTFYDFRQADKSTGSSYCKIPKDFYIRLMNEQADKTDKRRQNGKG